MRAKVARKYGACISNSFSPYTFVNFDNWKKYCFAACALFRTPPTKLQMLSTYKPPSHPLPQAREEEMVKIQRGSLLPVRELRRKNTRIKKAARQQRSVWFTEYFDQRESFACSRNLHTIFLRYFSYGVLEIEMSMNFSRYSCGSGKSAAREKWMMISDCLLHLALLIFIRIAFVKASHTS